MFKIIVRKHAKSVRGYSKPCGKDIPKTISLVKDSKEHVLLNGKKFKVSDMGELCEALTTGECDLPVIFNSGSSRYRLMRVEGYKNLTIQNPRRINNDQVADILFSEIYSLLEYNKNMEINVNELIKGLSKQYNISVKKFEVAFDKENQEKGNE